MTDVAIPAAPPEAEAEHAAPPGPIEIPEFQIVPRAGLAIAAVVLVALIVAIEVNKLWPLTFFHVAFGAAWTIIDLFLGLVLGPIMGQHASPGADPVHHPADAEDGGDHAGRGDRNTRRRVAARRS